MNVDPAVVEAWHPDNVAVVKNRNRELEVQAAEEQAAQDTAEAEEAAKKAKASERAKKAAATRKANEAAKRDAAKEADKRLAEEREKAQREQAEMRTAEG